MKQDTRHKTQDTRRGQVMLIAVLAIGGAMLGATTIAGLLTTYQVRQTIDMDKSAKAIYAADAGIEIALYYFFKGSGPFSPLPPLPNNATFFMQCYRADGAAVASCTDATTTRIVASGGFENIRRSFELRLQ